MRLRHLFALGAITVILSTSALAADVLKADNTNPLNDPGSWVLA